MEKQTIKELAIELTVDITTKCDEVKNRRVFVNQLLRACSSIGANASEAKYAQSRADFISKLEIALKECYETEYWLEILYKTDALTKQEYKEAYGKLNAKINYNEQEAKKQKTENPYANGQPNPSSMDGMDDGRMMGGNACSECISCCYTYLCVDCLFSLCCGCR